MISAIKLDGETSHPDKEKWCVADAEGSYTRALLLGEITQLSMSTKRSRARRHSISSLEEAAKKAAQEPSDSTKTAPAIMPTTVQQAEIVTVSAGDARYGKAKKRPLPIDADSLISDANPAKKFAMLAAAGGLSMEDLLKNAALQTTQAGEGADQQYLFLPGGSYTKERAMSVPCCKVGDACKL